MSKGKIFLADERGVNEAGWFRSYNTFNFGKYQYEHKKPDGSLYVLNDDTLAGGKSLNMLVEDDSYIIILPVAGAVQTKLNDGDEELTVAGQVQLLNIKSGTTITFKNPFREEPVNYLQIWIKAPEEFLKVPVGTVTYPDVNLNSNQLVAIFDPHLTPFLFYVSIGKFSGRRETVYRKRQKDSSLFVFVLEGAFEAEGRLLHPRDGLALYGTETAEMEALSNDAIIIVIETQANS